jgi:hypothetical protein
MAGSQDPTASDYFTCRFTTRGIDVDEVTVVMPPQPGIMDRIRVEQVPWQFGAPQENSDGITTLSPTPEGKPPLTLLARVINFRFVVGLQDKDPPTAENHHAPRGTVTFDPPITLEVSYCDDLAKKAGGAANLQLACEDPLTHYWSVFGKDEVFGEIQGFTIDTVRMVGIVTGLNKWIDPHIAWI